MRISDWSSDVCSSDLFDEHATVAAQVRAHALAAEVAQPGLAIRARVEIDRDRHILARLGQSGHRRAQPAQRIAPARDRRPTGVADTPADIVQCAHGRGQRIERGPEQGLEQGRRHAIQARVAMRPLRPSRRWEKKRRGSEIVHSPPPYAAVTPASASRSRCTAYRATCQWPGRVAGNAAPARGLRGTTGSKTPGPTPTALR